MSLSSQLHYSLHPPKWHHQFCPPRPSSHGQPSRMTLKRSTWFLASSLLSGLQLSLFFPPQPATSCPLLSSHQNIFRESSYWVEMIDNSAHFYAFLSGFCFHRGQGCKPGRLKPAGHWPAIQAPRLQRPQVRPDPPRQALLKLCPGEVAAPSAGQRQAPVRRKPDMGVVW